MLLATSFTSHSWTKRLAEKRKQEGLHTTRPWAIIQLVEDDAKPEEFALFDEDTSLILNINELPNISTPANKTFDDLSDKITKLTNHLYTAPNSYWLIVSCAHGTAKSAAIAKWVSDMYLIPIRSLYTGHDISTSNISRKIYNSINPSFIRTTSFDCPF